MDHDSDQEYSSSASSSNINNNNHGHNSSRAQLVAFIESGDEGSHTRARATMHCDTVSDIVIDDLIESEPTSAILSFCQRKFLTPYVGILGLVGLRPITIDTTDCSAYLGHVQTIIVVALLTTGYFIQYLSCFRRDRGFTNSTFPLTRTVESSNLYSVSVFYGETIFVYIVSCSVHFFGFLAALYVFRIADNEQLQNLVERVFILTHKPKRLFFILWYHIVCGFVWLSLMTVYIVVMEVDAVDIVKRFWFGTPSDEMQRLAKVLLIATTFCQDLVQVMVLTMYTVQCYLLKQYVFMLRKKLLENTIDPLDWMREMCEFRKLLAHLNKMIALPVCFFTLLNLAYTFSAIIYFIRIYNQYTSLKILCLGICNIFLWLVIGIYPFFQAASLTLACQAAQSCGHEVRIRPFVHRYTSAEELNSILLYASSLRMTAKLYGMPIHGSYVFFVILCIIIIILTLGMCINISLGII